MDSRLGLEPTEPESLPLVRGLGYERACQQSGRGMSELANRRREGCPGFGHNGPGGRATGVPRGGIMAPHASSALSMPLASEPEQLPTSPRLSPADASMAWPGDAHRRPLDVAQCAMCGIALPLGLLVPDGGAACADVRWYCKDARSCTERWTTARPPSRAYLSAVPGYTSAALDPAPAGTSGARQAGPSEQASPAT
jgi:hypothetical protein